MATPEVEEHITAVIPAGVSPFQFGPAIDSEVSFQEIADDNRPFRTLTQWAALTPDYPRVGDFRQLTIRSRVPFPHSESLMLVECDVYLRRFED